MKKFLIAVCALALFGCAGVTEKLVQWKGPEKAAKAVDEYCDSIAPAKRAETRALINTKTVMGDAYIYCVGDPDAPAVN